MHVMVVLDTIKKCGHFKDYVDAQAAYTEQKEAVMSSKTSLVLLDGASKGLGKSRKNSKKAKESKAKSKEADGATEVPKDPMRATFQVNLEKAKKPAKDAKGVMTTAASQMFAFYTICFLSKQSTHGTRLSSSRQKATCMWIYKASLRQTQGECPTSHLMIACCSTCSPCFPSIQQGKNSTTS
jgi:hypothetical protein